MGTLIRHAGLRLTLTVVALPVAMVEAAFRAALMAPVGFTALPSPRIRAAQPAAVALTSVTMRANKEQLIALAAVTKPRTQNRFAVFRHAPRGRALTTAIGSWQVRTSVDAWCPSMKVAAKPEPRRYERRGSFTLTINLHFH